MISRADSRARHGPLYLPFGDRFAIPNERDPLQVADFLLDPVRAAVNLSTRGVVDPCPNVKFILFHGGGFLPYAAPRMARHASPRKWQEDGMRLLRACYFDPALASTKHSLPSLLAIADRSHLTYGTDFPYAKAPEGTYFMPVHDAYRDTNHSAINRGNAELLSARWRAISR